MYSFFRKVVSTVLPRGSEIDVNDLEKEEERIINSIRCMNNDSETIPKNTVRQTPVGESEAVQYDVETFKCFHKSGKVTHLCYEYGLIDDVIYFEPSQVSAGLRLKPGDEVLYTAYQFKDNETFRVHKIYSLKNSSWDGDDAVNTGFLPEDSQNAEEIYALPRVVTGRVTRRRGREVFIESANIWCHLDKIQTTFIPVEGDWVELQAVVSISEDTADLMGEILEIKSLKPLLTKGGCGRISFWSETKREGAIENLIYFTSISCEDGYIPNLGDEVVYDAVESDQESFRWRAVKVYFNNLKQENARSNMDCSASNDSSAKDVVTPFIDKNDISITPSVCAVEVELNQTKTVTLEVMNHGTTQQHLKKTKFHRAGDPQLTLTSPKVRNNLLINPKQKVQFEFECCGKILGLTGEIFYFYFKDFTIARRFEITVVGNRDMNQYLKCAFDTVIQGFNSKTFYRSKVDADKVLYGPRPWKPPKFISRERKCVFNVPQNLRNILERGSGLKTVKALTKYAPYLKAELNFDQYLDRFHTLLFLEEIDLQINFRKYDMNEVYLARSDEYFVLEVPGLVEKRPSLIVGDKVLLTQSWHEGGKVKHIGFIYYIKEKEVYVKFHESFHETYNESECDISFEPNTNFFSRCHEGVNRANKLLGKEWLFPTSVNEKPPVIDFEVSDEEVISENVAKFFRQIPKNQTGKNVTPRSVEVTEVESNLKEDPGDGTKLLGKKKLMWVNKRLNERQKLAVVNVLKGAGRPLPYIIFGPPGTGKTVTLVESIIQIYRMIPESRILVTTPSNSSADLICERLIELGNFKPGQLVRLVALYRVIDGLVPPKLVPYSTYYNAKRNGKGIPDFSSKCKIKGISLEELPGRQRITIATCVTIGVLHYVGLPPGHFTHILVDEAGQTSEPEILISATFQDTRTGQIVLTGDPQQLGPVICSHIAKNFGLGVSLLQRLISTFPYARDFDGFPDTSGFDPRFITKLNVNYRTVPEILSLPSRLFYNSDLLPTVSQTDSTEAEIIKKFNFEVENRKTPPAIIFHGLIGQNYQEKDSPSWFNPHEIWQVVFYVRKLYSIGLKSSDIGIVSPYAKQVQKLKQLLPSLQLSPPKIGSVEEFQGQERPVIIVSTVRSSAKYVHSDVVHSLGFVASPQRLNVALTRARALLIIIGNPVLLSKDPYWVSVVNYCVKNNSYTGCSLDTFNENLKVELTDETEGIKKDTNPED